MAYYQHCPHAHEGYSSLCVCHHSSAGLRRVQLVFAELQRLTDFVAELPLIVCFPFGVTKQSAICCSQYYLVGVS